MIVRNLDSITKATAHILQVDEDLVKMVINHYFSYVRESIVNISNASINIPNLGTIYMSKSNYRGALKLLLSTIRKSEKEDIKAFFLEQFRILWKNRDLVHKYYLTNKTLNPFKND